MLITPRYSDLFKEKKPELNQLLKTFPSILSISILSKINAEIYILHNLKKDIRIIEFLTQRFDYKIKREIFKNIYKLIERNGEKIQFFTRMANLEFIHHELINYRNGNLVDSTPEQELNFLKAYFLIVEKLNIKFTKVYNNNIRSEGDFFETHTWPTLIQQIIANNRTNPIPNLIKGRAFLNFFEKSPKHKKNVENFLSYNHKSTSSSYILSLLELLINSYDKEKSDSNGKFIIGNIESHNVMVKNYLLEINKYKNKYGENYRNFSGLMDKPLLLKDSENCLVLNWDFIAKKLYDGLIFDFYQYSGIKNEKKFSSFPDFKNYIGHEITEKYLFKKLISQAFNGKHNKVLFDENQVNGYPDAYFRNGKHIYIFEIKDAFFPVDAINSDSVNEIIDAIDKKYNTEKKGIGQLIKHIKKLCYNPYEELSYEELSYEELKLKKRNLVIYPIMIYTDNLFGMPGINNYLNKEFNKKIIKYKLDTEEFEIKPLTFINLNFFIDMLTNFKNWIFKN